MHTEDSINNLGTDTIKTNDAHKQNVSEKNKEPEKNKAFALRISSKTMSIIEKWAADEFRSTNGQIQWIIEDAIRRYKRNK